MKCHRKCCIYTTLGVFLTACCIGVVVYFGYCENLYKEEDDLCGQVNQLVCDICQSCNSTEVCTQGDINLYCGIDCQNKKNDISDLECPHKNVGRGMIALFGLLAAIGGVVTVFYFLKEAFEEITGTQDDV